MEKVGFVGIILLGVLAFVGPVKGQLKLGFYDKTCPSAEKIVLGYVRKHIPNAPSLAASILRMHFHDCFVRGCDASLLLNSTSANGTAERDSTPNLTVRGFDFIEALKHQVEKECPGVVSCADILALAARDSVVTTGGPFWRVPTGRRDGTVSNSAEALRNIPAPSDNLTSLLGRFSSKGLNVKDLVLLSGSHTIGIAHCNPSFTNRLYNFTGKGDMDPSLDSEYAEVLKKRCRVPNDNTTIFEMDPGSSKSFDLSYYRMVLKRRGLFQSDAALTTGRESRSFMGGLLSAPASKFYQAYALSMEKMGRIAVKTGREGEIRKICAAVNH